MDTKELMNTVLQFATWIFVSVLALFIYQRWERMRREDRADQQMWRGREREEAREKEARERYLRVDKESESDKPGSKQQDIGGGYILLDMPESKKALFRDVLKGFEEYAKLKG